MVLHSELPSFSETMLVLAGLVAFCFLLALVSASTIACLEAFMKLIGFDYEKK